jgi:uncharacterized membrane protein YfcA
MAGSLLYAGAGLLVGLLIGLTGIGSGSILTPLLVYGFGLSPSLAIGTDLVFSATTKLIATGSLGHGRRIDWSIVRGLARGSVPAAGAVVLWLYFSQHSPPELDRLGARALAAALLLTGVALLFQRRLRLLGLQATAATLARAERLQPLATLAAGALLGAAVSLTSVGAGALGCVALLYLYPLRLSADQLVATNIAQALPMTLVAALGHAALGHVDLVVLGSLLLGAVPGVLLGTRTTIRLPQAVLRMLIAGLLTLGAIRLLLA